MAEAPTNGTLSLKTSFGEVAAKGSQVISAIFLCALVGIALYEHRLRSMEHIRISNEINSQTDIIIKSMEQNMCLNKLTVYQQIRPAGQPIDWNTMPQELWTCLPKFLTDPPKRGN